MEEFYLFHPSIENLLFDKTKQIEEKLHYIQKDTLYTNGVDYVMDILFEDIWIDAPIVDIESIKHDAYTKPPVHFVEYHMPLNGDATLLYYHHFSGDAFISGFITESDRGQKYLHFRFRDPDWARMFADDGEMRPESKQAILRQKNQALELLQKHIPLNVARFKEWYMEKRTEIRNYLEGIYKSGGGGIKPNITGL